MSAHEPAVTPEAEEQAVPALLPPADELRISEIQPRLTELEYLVRAYNDRAQLKACCGTYTMEMPDEVKAVILDCLLIKIREKQDWFTNRALKLDDWRYSIQTP